MESVLTAVRSAGLKVPGDLSLLLLGDAAHLSAWTDPLSCVAASMTEVAMRLFAALDGGPGGQVGVRLIDRGSLGAVIE